MKIKVSDISENKLTTEQAEALQKYFQEGGTWQELLELSSDEAESIYAVAYDHYEKEEWDKSIAAFSTLIQLNPYEPKYWMGIAAVMQMKKDYEEAIAAYQLVLSFDERHIQAHFGSAQCFYVQGQIEKCKEHLEKVKSLSESSEENKELYQQAIRVLQILPYEKESK